MRKNNFKFCFQVSGNYDNGLNECKRGNCCDILFKNLNVHDAFMFAPSRFERHKSGYVVCLSPGTQLSVVCLWCFLHVRRHPGTSVYRHSSAGVQQPISGLLAWWHQI